MHGRAVGTSSDPRAQAANRVAILLGLVWLADSLLQLQHYFFTPAFAHGLYLDLMADPSWMVAVFHAVYLTEAAHAALYNWLFAGIQFLIGIAIIYPPTRRLAVWASVPWALVVWIFGENMGAIFGGFTSLFAGTFPGAVLIYPLIGLIALPRDRWHPGTSLAEACSRYRHLVAWIWTGIFSAGALLTLYAGYPGPIVLGMNIAMEAVGQVQPLGAVQTGLAWQLSPENSIWAWPIVILVCCICILVATLPWWEIRRNAVWSGFAVLAIFWVIGQGFGGFYSGGATDISSAPLFAIWLWTFWPVPDVPVPADQGLLQ